MGERWRKRSDSYLSGAAFPRNSTTRDRHGARYRARPDVSARIQGSVRRKEAVQSTNRLLRVQRQVSVLRCNARSAQTDSEAVSNPRHLE